MVIGLIATTWLSSQRKRASFRDSLIRWKQPLRIAVDPGGTVAPHLTRPETHQSPGEPNSSRGSIAGHLPLISASRVFRRQSVSLALRTRRVTRFSRPCYWAGPCGRGLRGTERPVKQDAKVLNQDVRLPRNEGLTSWSRLAQKQIARNCVQLPGHPVTHQPTDMRPKP